MLKDYVSEYIGKNNVLFHTKEEEIENLRDFLLLHWKPHFEYLSIGMLSFYVSDIESALPYNFVFIGCAIMEASRRFLEEIGFDRSINYLLEFQGDICKLEEYLKTQIKRFETEHNIEAPELFIDLVKRV